MMKIFETVDLPSKITPCPIHECVIELRFDLNTDFNMFIGQFHALIKSEYSVVERLPILELPATIRENDQGLKFSPHYRFKKGNLFCQVGPSVVTLVCTEDYVGWENLYKETEFIFNHLINMNVIGKIYRSGVRYINTFDSGINIFDKTKLDLKIGSEAFPSSNNTNFRTELLGDGYNRIISISNNGVLGGIQGDISIVDIDIINTNYDDVTKLKEDFFKIINNSHIEEKKIFFGLLSEEFKKTFKTE